MKLLNSDDRFKTTAEAPGQEAVALTKQPSTKNGGAVVAKAPDQNVQNASLFGLPAFVIALPF